MYITCTCYIYKAPLFLPPFFLPPFLPHPFYHPLFSCFILLYSPLVLLFFIYVFLVYCCLLYREGGVLFLVLLEGGSVLWGK